MTTDITPSQGYHKNLIKICEQTDLKSLFNIVCFVELISESIETKYEFRAKITTYSKLAFVQGWYHICKRSQDNCDVDASAIGVDRVTKARAVGRGRAGEGREMFENLMRFGDIW